jgi:hypothetical protein
MRWKHKRETIEEKEEKNKHTFTKQWTQWSYNYFKFEKQKLKNRDWRNENQIIINEQRWNHNEHTIKKEEKSTKQLMIKNIWFSMRKKHTDICKHCFETDETFLPMIYLSIRSILLDKW